MRTLAARMGEGRAPCHVFQRLREGEERGIKKGKTFEGGGCNAALCCLERVLNGVERKTKKEGVGGVGGGLVSTGCLVE